MRALALLVIAVATAFTAPRVDASTRIDNVIMEVDPKGRAVTEITNIGDAPMGYVLTPYEWVLEDGEDVYKETKQFMAIPPTFQLAPGQTITVRVGFRNPTPARVERTFRLSVREVPTETAEEGLALAYEHMLPVYIAPAGGREPTNIEWGVTQRDGSWYVRADNKGNTRAVISQLVAGGQEVPTRSQATVLARSWREYAIPSSAITNGAVTLDYQFKSGSPKTVTVRSR
jgi:P pilus assembly chaperone PapD